MSLRVDQRMVDGRHRVLPDQLFLRHQLAEVARDRAHVAVRQLEPGAREGIGELLPGWPGSGARSSRRPDPCASPCRPWSSSARGACRGSCASGTLSSPASPFGLPLVRAGRALGQLPLVAEQRLEVALVPLGRRRRPRAFDAAGDGVRADAAVVAVDASRGPESSMFAPSGSTPTWLASPAPCALPKVWPPATSATVSSSFIAMRAKVSRMSRAGAERIGIAVRAFRVHVDQAHLHRAERIVRARGRRCSARRPARWPRGPSRCRLPAPRRRRGRRRSRRS